mmetsp:Transcript_38891/g.61485  ORF Transcript_38891/g.61485 Transcript_38891/m.61485 type:complete len:93 (-) Transcript_38891:187-465(-)
MASRVSAAMLEAGAWQAFAGEMPRIGSQRFSMSMARKKVVGDEVADIPSLLSACPHAPLTQAGRVPIDVLFGKRTTRRTLVLQRDVESSWAV